jgi:hypothetical protein
MLLAFLGRNIWSRGPSRIGPADHVSTSLRRMRTAGFGFPSLFADPMLALDSPGRIAGQNQEMP